MAVVGTGAAALLAGCSSSDDSSTPAEPEAADDQTLGGKLMLYTSCSDQMINAVVPAFEQATGVAVSLTQGTPAELFQMLTDERAKPVADAIWGGSPLWYAGAQDLLHRYVSANNSSAGKEWRNSSGLYTPVTLECPALMVVAPEGLGRGTKLWGYQSLLDAAFAGRVAMPDPAASDIAYQHLYSMLQDLGGPEADEAWRYVAALVPQLVGGAPVADVAAATDLLLSGEADVALVGALTGYEVYQSSDAKTLSVYPGDGATLMPSCAAVIAACDNLEQAQAWVDFLVSQEGQAALATEAYARPVRDDAYPSDGTPADGSDGASTLPSASDDLTLTETDIPTYVEQHDAILAIWEEVLAGTWAPAEQQADSEADDEGDATSTESDTKSGESVETSTTN